MHMFAKLKSLFRPASAEGEGATPPVGADLLAAGRAAALKEEIKALAAKKEAGAAALRRLLPAARSAGWADVELAKLECYIEMYSGCLKSTYQKVIDGGLAKNDFDLMMALAVQLYLFDRFAEARALFEQFDAAGADRFEEAFFCGIYGYIVYVSGAKIDEAIEIFDRPLDKGLHCPCLVVNAYGIYFEAGRHERTRELRQLIWRHYADDWEAIHAVSVTELACDYYPEGFRLAESRYRMMELLGDKSSINPSLLGRRRWQGEPLDGKRILVHAEQGLGDLVMCARYFPLLQQKAAEVVVHCREVAMPLLAHNYPGIIWEPDRYQQPVTSRFDCWTGTLSLPFHFDTAADSVPGTTGYLRIPPEQEAYWAGRLAELADRDALRIGLAWSGSPGHRRDKRRSLGFAAIESYVRKFPHVRFFALQTTVLEVLPANVINVSEELVTLADTAALIERMDLVITVDTSIVHIAGALGKPTWLLLPKRYEWRWSLEGEGNNWYDSVSVLRQHAHDDWSGVLEDAFGTRLSGFLASLDRPDK